MSFKPNPGSLVFINLPLDHEFSCLNGRTEFVLECVPHGVTITDTRPHVHKSAVVPYCGVSPRADLDMELWLAGIPEEPRAALRNLLEAIEADGRRCTGKEADDLIAAFSEELDALLARHPKVHVLVAGVVPVRGRSSRTTTRSPSDPALAPLVAMTALGGVPGMRVIGCGRTPTPGSTAEDTDD